MFLWANNKPHRGSRAKLKNMGLSLKINKSKSTQVRLNIWGLTWGPKMGPFNMGLF
jgi:hypothetical protein